MAHNMSQVLTQELNDRSWIKDLFVVLGASIIIALFAPISIKLPFSPVPIATQGSVVLFLGALLGSRRGAMAVMAYLAQGCFGLPVFAGAKAGILVLMGPTGGYLLGYIVAAYVTGLIVERMKERTQASVFGAMAVGNIAIFLCGMPQLASFVGFKAALILGVLPFLLGDFLKLLLAVKGLKMLNRV